MSQSSPNSSTSDPFDLARFIAAQEGSFDTALTEIRNGQKVSHWMWYIFPQLRGLGFSPTAQHYGITGAAEAKAYLAHEVLGRRLITVCEAALSIEGAGEGRSATAIFGTPDDLKLRSCATLFAYVSQAGSVFHQIIDKYFDGEMDPRTLTLLGER